MEKIFKSRTLGETSTHYHEQNNPHGFLFAPIDIIIPFHNEHNLVSRLIESIFNSVRTNRYQINLVDDGSDNESFINSLSKIPGVVSYRHEKQRGFGAAVNTAIQKTKQPYILILHSDVVVKGNTWLSKLGETYNNLRTKNIKMIGAMTDNPVVDDARMVSERETPVKDFILGDGFLPMYCVLCRRELFQRVGLLKEYQYAGYEAEEFSLRMRKMGYKQAVCGSSWVHHDGRGTLRVYDEDTAANRRVREAMLKIQETAQSDMAVYGKK
jgi:GT2 family glycosyltransferase